MEYKLEIYAPESEIEPIRATLVAEGSGVVGAYDSVIAISYINGYWRPSAYATPTTGEKNQLNFGAEVRIDVRCPQERVKSTIAAVKAIHPYEEPVINVIPLANHLF